VDPKKRIVPFDPEGTGYDYESARSGGIKPDQTGHWSSRNPKTGQLLKGRGHETFKLTEQGEEKAGYEIYKGDDKKYYSKKKEKKTFSSQQLKKSGADALTKQRKGK